jgi:predicted RNase H-like HicB family nuclease
LGIEEVTTVIVKLEVPIELTQEDGCFIAICPVFCVGSQGNNKDEALENAREALELYLEDKDVQEEYAETILHYAVSFILSDEEKKFRDDPRDIDSHVNLLGVEIHGNSEITRAVRA